MYSVLWYFGIFTGHRSVWGTENLTLLMLYRWPFVQGYCSKIIPNGLHGIVAYIRSVLPPVFRIPLLFVSPILVHARTDGGWKRCYTAISMRYPLFAAL